jgi:hypothetical protein
MWTTHLPLKALGSLGLPRHVQETFFPNYIRGKLVSLDYLEIKLGELQWQD